MSDAGAIIICCQQYVYHTMTGVHHLLSENRLWFDDFMDYGQIPGPLHWFKILMFFVGKKVQSFCGVNGRWPEMELFVEKAEVVSVVWALARLGWGGYRGSR